MPRGLFMAKKTLNVKEKANLRPVAPRNNLDTIHYWTTLLVLVTANIFSAIVFIPLMLLTSNLQFYLIIAILAILFGHVFSMLITKIENIELHHHAMAVIFIPLFSVVILIVTSNSMTGIASLLGLEQNKDPIMVSLFYIAFFLLPHAINLVRKIRL